ncbi:hypothetical protein [Methylocystis parvus]|uniref:Uncharacterized protein n=1 Tax=Methylocystis parvus TaxID=134 RepID=A0A6B8M238_9HYPH|nr:hypothetical protein [Methylocystis parvus]QGM96346.1 hypothetical protein F7D14_01810 [Methylocystis parvus]WBJ99815.1 hypothetical protein MMG94_17815 [Methylocystis parvus OBBP]
MGYLSPPPAPAPVIVYKDVGGLVTDYEAATEQYRRENREVRLHECRSACTLALSLPNVCVYPNAQVKFHQAYNAITREADEGVSAKLFASYPAAVQARLGYLTREYRVLSGRELIAVGMRNCDGDNPVLIAARKQRQAAPTALASANPPPGAAAGASSWNDVARKVQTAVAGAFSAPDEQARGSIRVAVADRSRIADPRITSDAVARSEAAPGFARQAAAVADAPLPPRRPPSEAFTAKDAAAANLPIIAGAQPILSAAFVRGDAR